MDIYDCIREKGKDITVEYGWARVLLYYHLKRHPDRMYATAEEIQDHYQKLGRQVPTAERIRKLLTGFESTTGDGFEMDGRTFQSYDRVYAGCIPKRLFDHFASIEAQFRHAKPKLALIVFWLGPIGAVVGIMSLFLCGKS